MRALTALALAFVLVGCAAPPPAPTLPVTAAPSEFPEAHYREALAAGKPVLRVDPAQSLVVIQVGRAGNLAQLGHDHVVASHDLIGYVSPDERRADLYLVLTELVVDEAPLRAEAGMTSQPSDSDIEGTRANMLNKVLEVDRFPYALVQVTGVDGAPGSATLRLSVTLHGATRTMQVPAQIDEVKDQVTARGQFSFALTEFGITPFSVMGGALAVRDRVDLRFEVRAVRVREW